MRYDATRNETRLIHMTDKKQSFARSYEVQTLVERIMKLAIGETITYEALATVAGADVDSERFAGQLQSARRIAQADSQVVTGTVRGVGIQRLGGTDIVKSGQQSIGRIRRESVRGLKRLACAKYEELDQAARAKHDATASHLGVLAEFAKPKIVTRIEAAASDKTQKLTMDETLKAFRDK